LQKWFLLGGAILIVTSPCSLSQAAPGKRSSDRASAESREKVSSAGEQILKIDVRGNLKIDREAILEKIGSKPGSLLDEVQIRKDIVAIHKLGYFDEIKVDLENGVLIYSVKERPAIQRIIFFGNDQVSTDDLKGALTLKTYDIYDEKPRARERKKAPEVLRGQRLLPCQGGLLHSSEQRKGHGGSSLPRSGIRKGEN